MTASEGQKDDKGLQDHEVRYIEEISSSKSMFEAKAEFQVELALARTEVV